jgi:mannosyltransferase OCH1-like enzyme
MEAPGDESMLSSLAIASDDALRSRVIQRIIQAPQTFRSRTSPPLPKVVVQFWDNTDAVPEDVQQCPDTWVQVEEKCFSRISFDDHSATKFIGSHLSKQHQRAFALCAHPAMRADYFRLCFIAVNGGFYIDADDSYQGRPLDAFVTAGHLHVQPLCYDLASNTMCDPYHAAAEERTDCIFYVNNNPLIAPARHPVVQAALDRATKQVLAAGTSRDIQSLTGPGNLTACLVQHVIDLDRAGHAYDFSLLADWPSVAVTTWPLSYRSDDRNWRNWIRDDV